MTSPFTGDDSAGVPGGSRPGDATSRTGVTECDAEVAGTVPAVVARARAAFRAGVNTGPDARRRNLQALRRMLRENRSSFEAALHNDLHKGRLEAGLTEIDAVLGEITHALRHLSSWLRPRRARTPLLLAPGSAKLVPEPLGVVLVMSPWNYPVNLTLSPLVGILAAGNTAVIKPSPDSPDTSDLIASLVPTYFPDHCVQVVRGELETSRAVLRERFDHIMFTGSGPVGRIVMEAAAQHLTPVTLELGGKSPAWFDEDAHLDTAARRLAWAKFVNAGQTCVAPDYVMTTPDRVPALVAALERAVEELWGTDPSHSGDYGRIINTRHFDRLSGCLDEIDGEGAGEGAGASDTGPEVAFGGVRDRDSLYMSPTVVTFPTARFSDGDVGSTPAVGTGAGWALLREEIFGPVLPVVPVESREQAVQLVNSWDKPLALYVFSDDPGTHRHFDEKTSSGAVVHNAGLIQVGICSLPFGGVGASGTGAYHGEDSFRTFSHMKPVLTKPLVPDTFPLLYPGTREPVRRLLGLMQRRG